MRRLLILLISSLLAGMFILGGCDYLDHDIEGPARENVPPIVQFVNIPVETAKFNSDTTIYWYGTDVDGFIVQFRYAVVEEEFVGDVTSYLNATPDSLIPWVELDVDLDDPQTNARVTMSADINDPVRKYVASYVFLQAVDNMGGKSDIVYRMFFKNNHFPNTSISSRSTSDPYVNTVAKGGILEGISVSWEGEDPIDYPHDPPPFQYQWRFYGPYDSTEMITFDSICVGSVFVDIYGDFYIHGETFPLENNPDTTIDDTVVPPETTIVIDTSWVLVDTLGRNNAFGEWSDFLYMDSLDVYSDFNRLVDSSYDPISDNIWVYDENTNIYDVYRNVDIDTTSQYYFLIWCQSRDDSKVPDPVPAFSWVSVIEPRFEREVIIIDASSYKRPSSGFWNWPVFPLPPDYDRDTEPLVKRFYGELVESWAGPGTFDFSTDMEDIRFTFPSGSSCRLKYGTYQASQDYYPIINISGCDNYGISPVTLRDMLKHKIVLIIKDNPGGELIMENDVLLAVIDGLNAGMSAWSMVRGPFMPPASGSYVDTVTWQPVPASYQQYFGVINMRFQGWQGAIMDPDASKAGSRIEDFVGADPLTDDIDNIVLPEMTIDTTLLEENYLWIPGSGYGQYDYRCPDPDNPPGEILIGALPEVGYVEKYLFATARYLYVSKYGNETPFMIEQCNRDVGIWEKANGSVVGITYNTGLFRTAHYSFGLLPMEETGAQECFNNMMDWLSVQPFIQTGKMAPQAAPHVDVQQLREVTNELHRMKAEGLLRSYGEGE